MGLLPDADAAHGGRGEARSRAHDDFGEGEPALRVDVSRAARECLARSHVKPLA